MKNKPYCSRCHKENVPLMKCSKGAGKQYYRCRPCNTAKMKAYFHTPSGREAMKRAAQNRLSKPIVQEYHRKYSKLRAERLKKNNGFVVCIKCDRAKMVGERFYALLCSECREQQFSLSEYRKPISPDTV